MDLSSTTTQDLIAQITNDYDEIDTFYARVEFTRRCNTAWRTFSPIKPRLFVRAGAGVFTWAGFLNQHVAELGDKLR